MLKNAALIVKIGFDTAEKEPQKEGCVVAQSAIRSAWTKTSQAGSRWSAHLSLQWYSEELVLGYISTDFDDQGRIFQHFLRSRRLCI